MSKLKPWIDQGARQVLVLLVCLGGLANNTAASTLPIEADVIDRLANHRVWHKLIFVKDNKPEIQSTDFYFSKQQPFSPKQELLQTIAVFNVQPQRICDYPARAYWLNQQLGREQFDLSSCQQLPILSGEISFILVSGYLKNPASTFGHILVSLGGSEEVSHLLWDSYNFGAKVNPDDNSLVYIFKGLFGLYHANFAKSEYFKQDAVYSKAEQRDMWRYVLNLSAQEKALIHLHLYESNNKLFNYYFIKQNCAYRTGELVELISDLKMKDRLTPWYTPDGVLQAITQSHPTLIKEVVYLPSQQKHMYAKYQKLTPSDQLLANTFLRTPNIELFKSQSTDLRDVLDFLIAYYTYQLAGQTQEEPETAIKRSLISLRLQLPSQSTVFEPSIARKPSPIEGPPPSRIAIGYSQQQTGIIEGTLFQRDPLSWPAGLDARFRAVDVALTYAEQEILLSHVHVLDMLKIENVVVDLVGESRPSWSLKTGIQKDAFQPNLYSTFIQGGLGIGYVAPQWSAYTLGQLELHDQDPFVDFISETGFFAQPFSNTAWRIGGYHQMRWRQHQDRQTTSALRTVYRISKRQELRADWVTNGYTLAYQYYW